MRGNKREIIKLNNDNHIISRNILNQGVKK